MFIRRARHAGSRLDHLGFEGDSALSAVAALGGRHNQVRLV